jgi:hypothetical protein
VVAGVVVTIETLGIDLEKPRGLTSQRIQAIRHLAFPHCSMWLCVFALFVFNCIGLALSERLTVEASWPQTFFVFPALALAFILLRLVVPRPFGGIFRRVWTGCMALFFSCALFGNLSVFNHLTMSVNFPMADSLLHSLDQMFGFDWLAIAKLISSNASFNLILEQSYFGWTMNGLICVVLFWVAVGREKRVIEVLFLLFATAFVCIFLSAAFPAEGAFAKLADHDLRSRFKEGIAIYHMQDLLALRSGEPVHLILADMKGLSTFPSFHTCLALLLIWCGRGNWFCGVPATALGVCILLATPVYGGHYVVDMLAGTFVFIACAFIWTNWISAHVARSSLLHALPDQSNSMV